MRFDNENEETVNHNPVEEEESFDETENETANESDCAEAMDEVREEMGIVDMNTSADESEQDNDERENIGFDALPISKKKRFKKRNKREFLDDDCDVESDLDEADDEDEGDEERDDAEMANFIDDGLENDGGETREETTEDEEEDERELRDELKNLDDDEDTSDRKIRRRRTVQGPESAESGDESNAYNSIPPSPNDGSTTKHKFTPRYNRAVIATSDDDDCASDQEVPKEAEGVVQSVVSDVIAGLVSRVCEDNVKEGESRKESVMRATTV
ncbi:hypothetical protein V5799_021552 [Amblyomma americanum]|uniref:Uncharacterized protein n=1 Tax=Amblyomma americanum TaxID=6943 RepID=A0AAQ4FQB8_AMBAM